MSANKTAPQKGKGMAGFLSRLRRETAGNTFLILGGGIFPVLGMLGGAADIGRQYMAQARLQLACDAGALAARRVMTNPAELTATDQATGNRFFDFNFPTGSFGTTTLTRTYAKGSSDGTVDGTASAVVPTTVMAVFGIEQNTVSVTCKSTLNVPNSDVMFVLDVTGSMSATTSDGVTRINGLKQAVKNFYTALGSGSPSTGRIRYGFVPYSSSVNVGYLLPRSALVGGSAGDTWKYQSREAVIGSVFSSDPNSPESAASTSTTAYTSNDIGSYSRHQNNVVVDSVTYLGTLSSTTTPKVINSAACLALTIPGRTLTLQGDPTETVTATTPTDASPVIVRTYQTSQNYAAGSKSYEYRWNVNNSECRLRSATVASSGTRTISYTKTQTTLRSLSTKWRYKERSVNVADYITGIAVPNPAYHADVPEDSKQNASPATSTWAGCIEETQTVNTITAASSLTIPTGAYDLKIDHVPIASQPETRWRPLWPDVKFWRHNSADPINSSNYGTAESDFGESVGASASRGFGACPAKARKLNSYASLTSAPTEDGSLTSFSDYVDSLQPIGGTYHDIGMVWGARLLSPDGLFGAGNANAPNGFPINRHIVFMTDGAMSANRSNYDAWGMNFWDGRVAGIDQDDTALTASHNKRFEMICNAAKAKGYTIWVVGFGLSALTDQMSACATDAAHASLSNSASSLSTLFQQIAQSIGGLRLTQ